MTYVFAGADHSKSGPKSNFTLEGLSSADVIEEEEDALADLFSDFETSIGQE